MSGIEDTSHVGG